MINEIKIDRENPVWAKVWYPSDEKCLRIYLYTFNLCHICVVKGDEDSFCQGGDYATSTWPNIEFPKKKKLVPLNAETCPRRPVLTHETWPTGVEKYPEISTQGLVTIAPAGTLLWTTLKNEGFLVNGLPASREVDE